VTEVNLFALVLENDPVFAKHLSHEPFTVAGDFIGEPMEWISHCQDPPRARLAKSRVDANRVGV